MTWYPVLVVSVSSVGVVRVPVAVATVPVAIPRSRVLPGAVTEGTVTFIPEDGPLPYLSVVKLLTYVEGP